MRVAIWSIGLVLAACLAACGSEAPAPRPSESGTEAIGDTVPVMGQERRILAFGDSLFAGYRVKEGESYPAKLEVALRARGINARVANAGVSGDTTAAALQRLDFTLDNQPQPPDLALVELGGNDMLRGIPPEETKANLTKILEELKQRGIPVLLIGMRAPPNLGAEYQRDFDKVYPALAQAFRVPLVPFFLQPIYDKPDLLQDDNIHPTPHGIEELVAATVGDVADALPKKEEASESAGLATPPED